MSDDQKSLLTGLCVGLTVATMILTGTSQTNKLRREAVELGYARYNETNGGWEWMPKKHSHFPDYPIGTK